ncbi:MAG: hypothetical protein V1925_05245 [Candidatus Omnitrophota bacterium]
MQAKNKIKLIVIMALIFYSATNLFNLFAQAGQEIPLPANTKELNTETRRLSGSVFDITLYSTSADIAQIKNFYRSRLAELGWQEQKLFDFSNMPGVKVDAALAKNLNQNIAFEKGKEMLTISFIPNKGERGETVFSLAKGTLEPESGLTETDFAPELLATPERDVAPLYPGAKLINLSERAATQVAVYYTADNIAPVASFYREKMGGYGWSLMGETPVKVVDTAHCPNCPQDVKESVKSVGALSQELNFSNKFGDRCKIGLFQVKPEKEKEAAITTIAVNYEENKQ